MWWSCIIILVNCAIVVLSCRVRFSYTIAIKKLLMCCKMDSKVIYTESKERSTSLNNMELGGSRPSTPSYQGHINLDHKRIRNSLNEIIYGKRIWNSLNKSAECFSRSQGISTNCSSANYCVYNQCNHSVPSVHFDCASHQPMPRRQTTDVVYNVILKIFEDDLNQSGAIYEHCCCQGQGHDPGLMTFDLGCLQDKVTMCADCKAQRLRDVVPAYMRCEDLFHIKHLIRSRLIKRLYYQWKMCFCLFSSNLGHDQLIPWMADSWQTNFAQSVGQKIKKIGPYFLSQTKGGGLTSTSSCTFSIWAFSIASVAPPCKESTDHGLNEIEHRALLDCSRLVVQKQFGCGGHCV